MAQQNRTVLKTYFETGDTPTEAEFIDLIDSSYNESDDGVPVQSGGDAEVDTLDVGEGNATIDEDGNTILAGGGVEILETGEGGGIYTIKIGTGITLSDDGGVGTILVSSIEAFVKIQSPK